MIYVSFKLREIGGCTTYVQYASSGHAAFALILVKRLGENDVVHEKIRRIVVCTNSSVKGKCVQTVVLSRKTSKFADVDVSELLRSRISWVWNIVSSNDARRQPITIVRITTANKGKFARSTVGETVIRLLPRPERTCYRQ